MARIRMRRIGVLVNLPTDNPGGTAFTARSRRDHRRRSILRYGLVTPMNVPKLMRVTADFMLQIQRLLHLGRGASDFAPRSFNDCGL